MCIYLIINFNDFVFNADFYILMFVIICQNIFAKWYT